jgi:diketogulonate reductase-like aldo/keto reductase
MTAMWPYRVNEFLRESLKSLQLEAVDLYLIQFPVGLQSSSDSTDGQLPRDSEGKVILERTHLEPIWKAMENEIKVGRTKAIGVCDFNTEQMDRIFNSCTIPPAVLQVYVQFWLLLKATALDSSDGLNPRGT